MRTIIGVMAAATIAAGLAGCGPSAPSVAKAVIEDKVYAVNPARVMVRAGIVSGEMTELKVTERVEQGSGRIDSPAKLTGTLKLVNSSADQTVRLIGGKLRYLDASGQPIKLEDARAEPQIRFTSYGNNDRLDPGQDATQNVSVEFPVAALKASQLKEILLDLVYLPSAYKQDTSRMPVSIGEPAK